MQQQIDKLVARVAVLEAIEAARRQAHLVGLLCKETAAQTPARALLPKQ
jgi:hypothetical protein